MRWKRIGGNSMARELIPRSGSVRPLQTTILDAHFRLNGIRRPSKTFLTTCRRLLFILLAFLSVLVATPAFAASCANVASLTDALSAGTPGSSGADSTSGSAQLETGDQLTINFGVRSGSGSVVLTLVSSPLGVVNTALGTFNSSVAVPFTPTAGDGNYSFQVNINGSGPFDVDVSATCDGEAVTPPSTEETADEKADAADANDRSSDEGRLDNSPEKLPDGSQNETRAELSALYEITVNFDERLAALNAALLLAEKRNEETQDEAAPDFATNLPLFMFTGQTEREADLRSAAASVAAVQQEIDDLKERNRSARNRIEALGENPDLNFNPYRENFTTDDPDDLGDGEANLFYPLGQGTGGRSGNLAYNAILGTTNGAEMRYLAQKDVFDIWSRFKFSILDGSLDRSGLSGHLQLGLVRSLSPELTGGAFLSGFASTVTSGTLGNTTDTIGGGLGGYLKYLLSEDLTLGISTSYELSSGTIATGTTTGNYLRDLFTIDASLAGKFSLDELQISPSAGVNWTYSNRHAFTDSSATAVPSSVNNEITVHAGLVVSQTFLMLEGPFASVTPNLGATINLHANRLGNLNLAGGNVVTSSPATGSVSGGLSFLFVGGPSLSLNASVSGIGGSTQGYTASIGLKAPTPH